MPGGMAAQAEDRRQHHQTDDERIERDRNGQDHTHLFGGEWTGEGKRQEDGDHYGPTRVDEITVSIDLPHGVPEERRPALLAVASHCTVHNSLHDRPLVSINLAVA